MAAGVSGIGGVTSQIPTLKEEVKKNPWDAKPEVAQPKQSLWDEKPQIVQPKQSIWDDKPPV